MGTKLSDIWKTGTSNPTVGTIPIGGLAFNITTGKMFSRSESGIIEINPTPTAEMVIGLQDLITEAINAAIAKLSIIELEFIATNGQTSFPCIYIPGNTTRVFINGLKISPSDYIATNGTQIILTTARSNGDVVSVELLRGFGV